MTQKHEARVYTDEFGRIIIEDTSGQPQLALDLQSEIVTEQAEIIAQLEAIIEKQIDQQKQPQGIESPKND